MYTYTHDVVQVIVYRRTPTLEFLVLRRASSEGGWWQSVTGHIEAGETALMTLRRELREEIGAAELLAVSERIYTYEHDTLGGRGRDSVYVVEVSPEANIILSDEHDEYHWRPLESALALLRYEGNKDSLRRAHAIITG